MTIMKEKQLKKEKDVVLEDLDLIFHGFLRTNFADDIEIRSGATTTYEYIRELINNSHQLNINQTIN